MNICVDDDLLPIYTLPESDSATVIVAVVSENTLIFFANVVSIELLNVLNEDVVTKLSTPFILPLISKEPLNIISPPSIIKSELSASIFPLLTIVEDTTNDEDIFTEPLID